MSLPTYTDLLNFAYAAPFGAPFFVVPAKTSPPIAVTGSFEYQIAEGEPYFGTQSDPAAGQPYILRVQAVPGMRTFSQMGHGGL